MKKGKWLVFCLVAGIGGLGTSFSAYAVEGKALYAKNCKRCHGVDGRGNLKMLKALKMKDKDGKALPEEKAKEKLDLLGKVSRDMTDAAMVELTLKGREGTKMKGFEKKLQKPDPKTNAEAIVKYVRELQAASK